MRVIRWLGGISAMAALSVGGIAVGLQLLELAVPSPVRTRAPRPDAEDAGCYVDASFSMFAASDAAGAGCAACVQDHCTTGIKACSTSCTCINLFTCLADAGISASGLGSQQPRRGRTTASRRPDEPGVAAERPGNPGRLPVLHGHVRERVRRPCSRGRAADDDGGDGTTEDGPERDARRRDHARRRGRRPTPPTAADSAAPTLRPASRAVVGDPGR